MLYPSHICRSWSIFQFQYADCVSIDYLYRDGNKQTYVIIYNRVDTKFNITSYAAYNVNWQKLEFDHPISFQPTSFDEIEMVVRPASDDEIDALKIILAKEGYEWSNTHKLLRKRFQPKFRPVYPECDNTNS